MLYSGNVMTNTIRGMTVNCSCPTDLTAILHKEGRPQQLMVTFTQV